MMKCPICGYQAWVGRAKAATCSRCGCEYRRNPVLRIVDAVKFTLTHYSKEGSRHDRRKDKSIKGARKTDGRFRGGVIPNRSKRVERYCAGKSLKV